MAQPGCQIIIVCDSNFYAAGFNLSVEDNLESEELNKDKIFFWLPFVLARATETLNLCWRIPWNILSLCVIRALHIESVKKPVKALTDNKSVTRFFQKKEFPGNLWNTVNYVWSFNFVLGHIFGKATAAADYLLRKFVTPSFWLKLKLTDRFPVKDLEVQVLAQTPA